MKKIIQKIKIVCKKIKWKVIFSSFVKIIPIFISLIALTFSFFSFTHGKYQEKLSYKISTLNDKVDIIKIGKEDIEASRVCIERTTGFIDKTIVIVYKENKYWNVSEMPTSSFISEMPLFNWLQPEKNQTSVGVNNLPIFIKMEMLNTVISLF